MDTEMICMIHDWKVPFTSREKERVIIKSHTLNSGTCLRVSVCSVLDLPRVCARLSMCACALHVSAFRI